MSEYQYYEFVAVDRPLDQGQMGRLRALSTRATITPTGFVNTYNWGDFRGDPGTLMEQYFDGFLYLANWGTRRVMLRLPARLVPIEVANRYCVAGPAQAWTSAGQVILDLSSEHEEGYWEEADGEGLLAGIIPVRAELLSGDLRGLYLAWLACVQAEEVDPDEPEPPVPPGLDRLSASQCGLADFLRIDPDLRAVAAETSSSLDIAVPTAAEMARWVAEMPAPDKDAVLLRLLHDDDPHLRAELLRRFRDHPPAGNGAHGRRTAGQLLAAAQARQEERERGESQRLAAEQARRERVAAAAREAHLTDLAGREPEAWRQVSTLIATTRPKDYDAAVVLLRDLRDVSARAGTSAEFTRRMGQLHQQHQRKPSLIDRMRRAGLIREPV